MQSYGIHVARMAGLDEAVLSRAAEIEAALSGKAGASGPPAAQTQPARQAARPKARPADDEGPLLF
jgi:DNA mismatch repair ATPase MutS